LAIQLENPSRWRWFQTGLPAPLSKTENVWSSAPIGGLIGEDFPGVHLKSDFDV
jgi:hypothetical protein